MNLSACVSGIMNAPPALFSVCHFFSILYRSFYIRGENFCFYSRIIFHHVEEQQFIHVVHHWQLVAFRVASNLLLLQTMLQQTTRTYVILHMCKVSVKFPVIKCWHKGHMLLQFRYKSANFFSVGERKFTLSPAIYERLFLQSHARRVCYQNGSVFVNLIGEKICILVYF